MVLDTIGGGSRIRTGDILLAKQTLYQLSYTPNKVFAQSLASRRPHWLHSDRSLAHSFYRMVGLTRIELVTSSLSGTRSNQLSYKPTFGRDTEQLCLYGSL